MSEFISVHLGKGGDHRKASLEEIAATVGAIGQRGPSISKLNQMIADGEMKVTKVTTLKWFDDYAEAEDYAARTGYPLWDTKSDPHRYAVGHLTIEEEEDLANQEWVQLLD